MTLDELRALIAAELARCEPVLGKESEFRYPVWHTVLGRDRTTLTAFTNALVDDGFRVLAMSERVAPGPDEQLLTFFDAVVMRKCPYRAHDIEAECVNVAKKAGAAGHVYFSVAIDAGKAAQEEAYWESIGKAGSIKGIRSP